MPGASGEFLFYTGGKNGKERRMRVLIADDDIQVRSALRLHLEEGAGISVVGEADNSNDLLAKVEASRPDLLLLDWELPPSGGFAVLRTLQAAWPQLVVFVLSGRPEVRSEALTAGATDFVSKADSPEHLLATILKL
jgi:sigma-B regulation protein RsbU (phosphoserine phosphatase)